MRLVELKAELNQQRNLKSKTKIVESKRQPLKE